jgi:hypothetical protein
MAAPTVLAFRKINNKPETNLKIIQAEWRDNHAMDQVLASLHTMTPNLILAFGSSDRLAALALPLAQQFSDAILLGCTTAGEISTHGVSDDSCVVTALQFDSTRLHSCSTVLQSMEASQAAGQQLAVQLPQAGLRAVIVLGQGVNINGSAMIAGMVDVLGHEVLITGGLAGDKAAFKETFVLDNAGLHNDRISCVGLYGDDLMVSHGSFCGWMPFGPARKVTRCANNVLFELDGEPALEVYKRYLGEHAKDLPASGLLFPFAMLGGDHTEVGLIRTILAVDEALGSLTLAGDIVANGYLRLMHASTDALVDGAEAAAQAATMAMRHSGQGLALLVSCVGRKLVMGGRVEEEVEAVVDVLSKNTLVTGFYSYGEISPFSGEVSCKLHNQTMTITYLTESAAPT